MADQSNFDFLFKVRRHTFGAETCRPSEPSALGRPYWRFGRRKIVSPTLLHRRRRPFRPPIRDSVPLTDVLPSCSTATVRYPFSFFSSLMRRPLIRVNPTCGVCACATTVQFSRDLPGTNSTSSPSRPSASSSLRGPLQSTARPLRRRFGTLVRHLLPPSHMLRVRPSSLFVLCMIWATRSSAIESPRYVRGVRTSCLFHFRTTSYA